MRGFLLALVFCGCASEEPEPAGSLSEASCVDGGRAHKPGESWNCADGCNRCTCTADGKLSTTTAACDATPPFTVDTSPTADTRTPASDTAVSDTPSG